MSEVKHQLDEFPIMVSRLAKSGLDIQRDIKAEQLGTLMSSAYALVAIGDALDKAKKVAIYQKDPDSIQHDNAYVMATISAEQHKEECDTLLKSMKPETLELLHGVIGVAGEAIELLDSVLNHIVTGQELDRVNFVEEIGDIEFYLEATRANQKVTRDETLSENMSKLAKRYEGFKYSNQAAQERKDKEGQ